MLVPRVTAVTLLAALAASGALAPLALADGGSACTPTAIGLVCRYDANGDDVPERVFVYSDDWFPLVTLDVWRQGGTDTLTVGAASGVTPYGPTAHHVTVTQFDAGADGSAEERRVDVESWAPSDIGGFATFRVHDGNGNGFPERATVFVVHSHHGTFAWSTDDLRQLLP